MSNGLDPRADRSAFGRSAVGLPAAPIVAVPREGGNCLRPAYVRGENRLHPRISADCPLIEHEQPVQPARRHYLEHAAPALLEFSAAEVQSHGYVPRTVAEAWPHMLRQTTSSAMAR